MSGAQPARLSSGPHAMPHKFPRISIPALTLPSSSNKDDTNSSHLRSGATAEGLGRLGAPNLGSDWPARSDYSGLVLKVDPGHEGQPLGLIIHYLISDRTGRPGCLVHLCFIPRPIKFVLPLTDEEHNPQCRKSPRPLHLQGTGYDSHPALSTRLLLCPSSTSIGPGESFPSAGVAMPTGELEHKPEWTKFTRVPALFFRGEMQPRHGWVIQPLVFGVFSPTIRPMISGFFVLQAPSAAAARPARPMYMALQKSGFCSIGTRW